MRWLLVVAVAVVVALLAWLGANERGRAERERRPAAEAGHQRASPAVADAEGGEDVPEAVPDTAVLEGTVSGKYGGIWAVSVRAYAAGTDRMVAETWTDAEGRYALALPVGTPVDVLAEPGMETGLHDQWRDAVSAPAVVDFVFGFATKAEGRVRCVGWKRYTAVDLMAIPEDRFAGWDDPGGLRPAASTHVSFAEDEAPFRFEGLPPGVYRLVVSGRQWMLREPVRFTAESKGIEAVAVRAFGLQLRVEDATLALPVAAFRVVVQFDEQHRVVWDGRDGLLRRRIPHPVPDGRGKHGYVEISASDYVPEREPLWFSGLVRLRPLRDVNIHLRVRYDDGTDCAGGLHAEASREGIDPFGLGFERGADGRWQGSLPPGDWTLVVWRKGVVIARRHRFALEVPVDGAVEHEIVVSRTGTLILRGDRGRSVFVAPIHDDHPEGVRSRLAAGEWRLPPGRYRLWTTGGTSLRDVDLGAGERVAVDIPPDDS